MGLVPWAEKSAAAIVGEPNHVPNEARVGIRRGMRG